MTTPDDGPDGARWFIGSLIALFAAGVLLAVACGPLKDRELTDFGVDDFEVTAIHPPKHFHIDLRNVRTGEELKRVRVSKHYNEWREVKVGAVIRVSWEKWSKGGEEQVVVNKDSILLSLKKLGDK